MSAPIDPELTCAVFVCKLSFAAANAEEDFDATSDPYLAVDADAGPSGAGPSDPDDSHPRGSLEEEFSIYARPIQEEDPYGGRSLWRNIKEEDIGG